MTRSERLGAYAISIAAVVATAWPLTWPRGRDSFPLSSYPMFSHPRERAEVVQALGLDRRRRARPLPPRVVANEEPMQAAAMLRRAARGGRARADALCRHIARRVAEDPEFSELRRVEIARVTYDPVRYLTHGPEPENRRRVVRCRVR